MFGRDKKGGKEEIDVSRRRLLFGFMKQRKSITFTSNHGSRHFRLNATATSEVRLRRSLRKAVIGKVLAESLL